MEISQSPEDPKKDVININTEIEGKAIELNFTIEQEEGFATIQMRNLDNRISIGFCIMGNLSVRKLIDFTQRFKDYPEEFNGDFIGDKLIDLNNFNSYQFTIIEMGVATGYVYINSGKDVATMKVEASDLNGEKFIQFTGGYTRGGNLTALLINILIYGFSGNTHAMRVLLSKHGFIPQTIN